MRDERLTQLRRFHRIVRHLEAASGAPADVDAERAVALASTAFRHLFVAETGVLPNAPAIARDGVRLVFAPGRDADPVDPAFYQAHAALFLRYAPIAGRVLDPTTRPADAPHALMLWDALALLARHNRALRAADMDYGVSGARLVPFADLFQRSHRALSVRSTDVNMGAALLSLALESWVRREASRRGIGSNDDGPAPVWRLFQALGDSETVPPVDLTILVTVYNWALRHRRSGSRAVLWLNFFANDLVAPLFAGAEAAPDVAPEADPVPARALAP